MKALKLSLFLVLSILGATSGAPSLASAWFKGIAETNIRGDTGTTASPLDRVTYTLVDTTAYLMQLAKTGLLLIETGFEDPIGPLFDVVYNTTRVRCAGNECAKEEIYMEFREPSVGGTRSIQLETDFQLDRFNISLRVDDLTIYSPGYRHTIRTNTSTAIRRGERATFALRNATYGIAADYQLVAGVGIQVANVDITLSIGEETWTVDRTFTELDNGDIVEDGVYLGDLKEDVMTIWNGQVEGEPFEKNYEQRAEFALNCGLSGGRSSDECEDAKENYQKLKNIFSKQ